jgi:hypothetical protein
VEPTVGPVLGAPAAPQVRTVEAGRGLGWWTDAWALFTRAAGMWIALVVAVVVASFVIALVPLLGGLAVSLLTPVVTGSLMIAARKVEGGGNLTFDDLLTGFREKFSSLIVLGVILLGASVVVGIVAGVLGLGAVFGAAAGGVAGSASGVFAALGAGALLFLLAFVAGALIGMALWFAPALVALDGVAPVEAIKLSFDASLKNIVPFLVYGILYFIAAIVATIPAGLGWIVLLPVLVLTVYVSYKDVFGR